MSVGNLKTNGNKGNNFPFQLGALQLLGLIEAGISGLVPPGGLATEATALSILAAIQNGRDFEQNLVIDTGGVGCPANCPTYTEIRIWNGTSFDPPTYYNAAGAVVVPVGPLEYVNPQFTLEDILQQLVAANALLTTIDGDTSNLDVALSTRATEATLALIKAKTDNLDVLLSTIATEATLALIKAKTDNLDVALSTRATEATLALIKAKTDNIDVALSTRATEATLVSVDTEVTNLNTPVTGLAVNMLRSSAVGSVTAGKRSMSFYNAGAANATVAGATLKPGEAVSFSADGLRDVLAAVNYDGTGTDLLITSVG